jgi:uncharacterized membrane protein
VENVGPIQMLCLAFEGNKFKGELLPELDRLKREEVIRIIDLLVVRKDDAGRVMVMTSSDLDWEEATAFGSYVGALAGFRAAGPAGLEAGAMAGAAELADGHLFDENDTFRVTQSLPNNMSAAFVLIEHLWAKDLIAAVERAGGRELSNDWLKPDEILHAGHDVRPRSDVD